MSLVYFLVQQMMLFSIPLLIVALGGMFCERSGVINIALEGIMVLGGFTGILFINLFQGVLPGQPVLLIALVISMVTGMVISLVHAYASINMKANQSISGTAINMFAPAFAIFVARVIRNVQQIPFENQFRIEKVPVLGDIPVIGGLFFQNAFITTYLGISGIPVLANLGIPSSVYKMIPYLATLIVLTLNTKGSQSPKASGVPYDKGAR